MSATAAAERPELGEISESSTYPLPVFQRLTGLSAWALRQARRRGLKMKTVGRRKFITGRAWLAYLETVEDRDE